MTATWIVTVSLLVFLYFVSFKIGLVDHPGGRKKHDNAVPLVGGIAIFVGMSVVLYGIIPRESAYVIFWSACCILMILSILDDLYSLRPASRLVTQSLLMCWIMLGGNT